MNTPADIARFALALAVSGLLAAEFDLDGDAPELAYHREIFGNLRTEPPRRNGIRKWRACADSAIASGVYQIMGEQRVCRAGGIMRSTADRLIDLGLCELDDFGDLVAL